MRDLQKQTNERQNTENVKKALLGVFPSEKSFNEFTMTKSRKKGKRDYFMQSSHKFIQYAYKHGLIQEATKEAFLSFIKQAPSNVQMSAWDELTFSEILDEIKSFWEYDPTIAHLIRSLNPIAEQFGLDYLQPSTFSRLVGNFNMETPVNQATLRILSYWIAANCPDYHWNYEKFRKFQTDISQRGVDENIQEGVVIAFSIQRRGGIVKTEALEWLKQEVSACLDDIILYANINPKDIDTENMSFISLSFPRRPGGKKQPRLYGEAIRDSLSVVHQIICRWFLTDHCLGQQKIIIGIYAGEFKNAHLFQDALFELQPDKHSKIILNEFAYQCARLANMKVVFKPLNESGKEFQHLMNTWRIEYFWSFPYFEFVPVLLQNDWLPVSKDDPNFYEFLQDLYSPNPNSPTQFKALAQMLRLPYNLLLSIEIVKVLISREMFHEADEILTNLLIFDPYQEFVRTTRMFIYAHIGAAQQDFDLSDQPFKRAVSEGKFLIEDCECRENSEVWSTFGLVYYSRAMNCLKQLRSIPYEQLHDEKKHQFERLKAVFFTYLQKASEILERGTIVSPSGTDRRAIFLEIIANGHLRLFRKYGDELFKGGVPIRDPDLVLKNVGREYLSMVFDLQRIDLMFKRLEHDFIRRYGRIVLLSTFLPNITYMYCVFMWDFMPVFTPKLYNMVIQYLEEARTDAETLMGKNLTIYSVSQRVPFPRKPDEFITFIDYVIAKLNRIKVEYMPSNHDENAPFDETVLRAMSTVLLHFQHLEWKEEKGRVRVLKENKIYNGNQVA